MAYQKKCYRSIDSKTGKHQSRGGGLTTRLNKPHRYATRPVEQPISPTYKAACAGRSLYV
jgi:hypothetical protein